MFLFNKKFFFFALILFLVELVIAMYVRDSFVRPYVGDYIVVILIYCAVRAFFNAPIVKVAIGVLLFSYLVEILQYIQIINRLGLVNNLVVKTIVGYGFEWFDLLAYTLGIITVLILERKNFNKSLISFS
jgi:hypothetical protein